MTYVLNNYEELEEDKPLACDPEDQATSCLFGYQIPCESKYGREKCMDSIKCTKTETVSCEIRTTTTDYGSTPDVSQVPGPESFILLASAIGALIWKKARVISWGF